MKSRQLCNEFAATSCVTVLLFEMYVGTRNTHCTSMPWFILTPPTVSGNFSLHFNLRYYDGAHSDTDGLASQADSFILPFKY